MTLFKLRILPEVFEIFQDVKYVKYHTQYILKDVTEPDEVLVPRTVWQPVIHWPEHTEQLHTLQNEWAKSLILSHLYMVWSSN